MSLYGGVKAKNEKSLVNQWVGRLGSAARMRASKYDCAARSLEERGCSKHRVWFGCDDVE